MAKISSYPVVSPPTLSDYVIGTDINNSLNTKNFLLSDILSLAGSVVSLEDLVDVSAQSPSNNDIIAYSSSTSLWEKTTISGALGYVPENTSNKGVPDGYAPLSSIGKVDAIYLPSYVDDVLEYPNFASFPLVGSTGIIYIDLSTNDSYRWGGTLYVLMVSGSATWGSIGGLLVNQLDLSSALNSKAVSSRLISTAAPLMGGGDLTADRTISISQATTSSDGYLSSIDWNTFNDKVSTSRSILTASPLTGGGDLSTNRTISIPVASTSTDGYLSATDWNIFNNKLTGTNWIDYSALSTIVGWSSFTTKTIRYRIIGKQIFVYYVIAGASNSSTTTFTLPILNSQYAESSTSRAANNGVNCMCFANMQTNTGLVNFFRWTTLSAYTASWTSSGTKFVFGQLYYEIP